MSDPDMGQPTVESERLLRIQHILDDCIERRIAGDPVSDQDLIAAHPDLLPELADELQHLAVIERARRRASDSKAGTDSGNASPLPETPAPPDLFPGYQVLDEIHRGGQGVVYRALQESTQRVVAIKVAAQGAWATEAEIARLEREVQVLGSLKHPGIVSIIDSGIAAAGSFYYVMHYIEGRPLDKYLRHRGEKATRKEGKRAFQGMPAGEAIDLLLQIGDAVNAAHLKGVIHRDLKPGNILIDGEGRPHLLDFGLAKIAEPEGVTAMTQTGQFVGSMPWASPEQAEGRTDQVDTRTDVYALGVVAYQMLTGQFPYEITGSIHEVIDRIINVSPQRPSGIRQGVDREIETIVLKCLSKEPDRRYQTAGELARDIRRFQANEPIEAKRDSGWYIVRKTISRHKAAFIASVAFVVLITASAISLAVMYRQQVAARDAEAMARREAESVLGFLTETLGQASPGLVNDRNMTVRTALDRAADRVSGDFPDSPRIEATIRNTIGVTYNGLGLYDEARVHLARALDIRRIEYGSQATPAVQTMV
ncbi:MAG: serine/threonine protein kinase, partial [Planctomycetota bacterium]